MSPNELLLWLSARKEGSWLQFRGAVERLDLASHKPDADQDSSLALHHRIRLNFERLGHVEFGTDDSEKGWRAVPPTLALSQHKSTVCGVLCGARTPKLLDRVRKAGAEFGLQESEWADSPHVVRMQATDAEPLIALARNESLMCQLDAPTALLSNLPPIASIGNLAAAPMPHAGREWEVKQFTIEKRAIKWKTVTVQIANAPEAEGLFCFTRYQTPQYFLKSDSRTISLPGSIGKFIILRRRNKRVLRYDRQKRLLSVPAICRPPVLTERALILCSGFPATYSVQREQGVLSYSEIPEEVAGMAAEGLNQDLL